MADKSTETRKKEFEARITDLETKLANLMNEENQTSSPISSNTSKSDKKRGTLPKGFDKN